MKTKEIDQVFLKKLGERIKALRIQAGFQSQELFSYECKVPRAQYARYEKGSNITMMSLMKIIKFHKMTFAEFFGTGF